MTDIGRMIGNERLLDTIKGFARDNSFPNSMIISGPSGSGKRTFATLIALYLGCRSENRPCMTCPDCVKITENLSPDVIWADVPSGSKYISVNDVRSIKDSAYVVPNDLDVKIYIINNADRMTVQAQNALLKLFEEPPKSVYFILLCSKSSLLLPTVRSRAIELHTETFTKDVLREYIVAESEYAGKISVSDPVYFDKLITLSGGSVGRALDLFNEDTKINYYEYAEKAVEAISEGSDFGLIDALQNGSGSSREGLTVIFDFILMALRDMASVKRNRESVDTLFFTDSDRARKCCASLSLKSIINIFDTVSDARFRLEYENLNVFNTIISTASAVKNIK